MSTTQTPNSRSAAYPTDAHRAVVEVATAHFVGLPQVDTILLVNSLARGQGTPQSDVDMAILVKPTVDASTLHTMEHAWSHVRATDPTIVAFEQSSHFAHIHLDVISGHIEIETWDEGGGPDYLEVGIGNQFFYWLPLAGVGSFYQELQAQWLPYYNEDLRRARLEMVAPPASTISIMSPFLRTQPILSSLQPPLQSAPGVLTGPLHLTPDLSDCLFQ